MNEMCDELVRGILGIFPVETVKIVLYGSTARGEQQKRILILMFQFFEASSKLLTRQGSILDALLEVRI